MAVPHGIDRSGAAGGTGAQGMTGSLNDLTDPGADRILFWDDSAGDLDWLSLGTGLSTTDTSMALAATLVDVAGLTPSDGGFIVGDGANFVVESGATARASLGISEVTSPDAAGDFIIGETASNPISVPFVMSGSPMINGKVALSVAASALTITITGMNDAALSTSNALFARMPQGNPLDGTYAIRKSTAALTLTVSHGSTLGTANGATTPLYVYLLDNAGTLELAISATYYGQQSVRSTTTEGGAGGADTFTTIYSTTGRTSVPIVPILKWDCAQTSAGVWLTITGEKQLAPGDRGWLTFGSGLTLSNAVLSATYAMSMGTEQATTSGTSVDFTGIPAGVRRISLMLNAVSTSGASPLMIQLGDAGGFETTNYLSSTFNITSQSDYTIGFGLTTANGSTLTYSGIVTFTLEDASDFTWVAHGGLRGAGSGNAFVMMGLKSLSEVLTQVRLTTNGGTDTFDAGTINIAWE